MSNPLVFEGWIFQHEQESSPSEPVSTGTLRQLLAASYLHPHDTAWKCFEKDGKRCLSSPVTVAVAVKDDNSSA
jgi:hypothetical protein